jgi:hypothetical protein
LKSGDTDVGLTGAGELAAGSPAAEWVSAPAGRAEDASDTTSSPVTIVLMLIVHSFIG